LIPYRLAAGVHWRCWEDGCVVFSAATARTMLLAPEYRACLSGARAASAEEGAAGILQAGSADPDRLQQLVDLGVLELLP